MSDVEKFKPLIIDPSLLCIRDFWEEAANLRKMCPQTYFPASIGEIEDRDFHDFFGSYRRRTLIVDEVYARSREFFQPFSWEEHVSDIPQALSRNFEVFNSRLRESRLSRSIQETMLDEFSFACTQSSIISRLKKIFKLFEEFQAIRLINLEDVVPEQWRDTVKGIKNVIRVANWIATLGEFSMSLGLAETVAIEGIRLFLIDPK